LNGAFSREGSANRNKIGHLTSSWKKEKGRLGRRKLRPSKGIQGVAYGVGKPAQRR